jgi:signal transduction histidine kinase
VRPGHYDSFLVPLKDDGRAAPSGVLVIIRDVTERDRLAEEATRLRLRRQQEVLAAILTTQENERKRIAEALHNGLGQVLYATKLSLEGSHAAPRESLKLLDEAIRTARTISFELTPGILEDFGLRTALEELVKRVARVRLPVRMHVAGLEQRLPPQVEIAVYRVVQELLNNVMKHAHASEVVVHVAHEDSRLEVSVEDNGCGFETAALAAQPLTGIGLAGMRNRVALLGGELSINSQLGRGTIVSFEVSV